MDVRTRSGPFASFAWFVAAAGAGLVAQKRTDYHADVAFAVDELGTQCRALLASKKIDWKKATAPLLKDAKATKTDGEHLQLLWRLVARLQDGHAEVRPLEKGKDVKVDSPDRSAGPGLFLCRNGERVLVKNAWGPAAGTGVAPGMEVRKVDGTPALQWLQARAASLADTIPFSTPQQAFFFACHQGLADAAGTRVAFELRAPDGKEQKRTITWGKANQTPPGPAFAPCELTSLADVHFGRTQAGFGYVHVRRCKETVVTQVDEALAALGDVPGMILDFRGNSGGAFDHDALFGRFLCKGKTWAAGATYRSAGERPYGGPLVVIVDATVRSAGETAAGMFLEDGRAYGIGESPTAGMSSSKTTIELPSRLFALYVSVASNKARFQGGRGIEGLGVIPHEFVAFAQDDLAAQRDTLIARAEALLADFPQAKVRYEPAKMGWTPPAR
jgi:hypothetical protein